MSYAIRMELFLKGGQVLAGVLTSDIDFAEDKDAAEQWIQKLIDNPDGSITVARPASGKMFAVKMEDVSAFTVEPITI